MGNTSDMWKKSCIKPFVAPERALQSDVTWGTVGWGLKLHVWKWKSSRGVDVEIKDLTERLQKKAPYSPIELAAVWASLCVMKVSGFDMGEINGTGEKDMFCRYALYDLF